MKLKVDTNSSALRFFCGCLAKSNIDKSLSERLLQETYKSNDYAPSPISTARYTDEVDEEEASLVEEIPVQSSNNRTKEVDAESVSSANKTRLPWRTKAYRSLERWKDLAWNTRKGYRQVDDSLPDDVLSILFSSPAEKDTSLDFLSPIQQENRLTLSLISAGSSLMNVSVNAEYPQLELHGRISENMTEKVPTTKTIIDDVSEKEEEEEEGSFLNEEEVCPTDPLNTPYPLVLSGRLIAVREEITAPSQRPADVCQDDLKTWRQLDTLARSCRNPLIQKPSPTIIKRQLLYSANEDEDEELSFANSENSLLFEVPGIVRKNGSR